MTTLVLVVLVLLLLLRVGASTCHRDEEVHEDHQEEQEERKLEGCREPLNTAHIPVHHKSSRQQPLTS